MSKAHLPPVPSASRAPIGGSANPDVTGDVPEQLGRDNAQFRKRNLREQGNIRQNTKNQGQQQDR